MRIGIYKDTLANRRGADFAVLALAEGLRERFGVRSGELGVMGCEVVVFEKKDFEKRIKEPWDVIISTGTNELLDLAARWGHRALPFPIPRLSSIALAKEDSSFPIPVIQQFHTNPKSQFKWKRFFRNWKIRSALRCVSVIQVLSEDFVPQVKKYGVPVCVIGNWSMYSSELRVQSLELDAPQSNSRLIIHNSQLPTIIYPAAFSKGKNQKLLIKAFAKVAPEFPDWRLRLLGNADGRYAEECRKLVDAVTAAKPGAPRIEFAGYVKDMAAEYEKCEFVAFPSLDEGFSLTIVDAAAFAKPCVMVKDWIGTGNGERGTGNPPSPRLWRTSGEWGSASARATVDKTGNGGVVTEPTVDAYAAGLRRLMADADLRRRMGRNANEYVSLLYNKRSIMAKWEDLVKRTVGSGQ